MRSLTKFSNDQAFHDAAKPSTFSSLFDDYAVLINETDFIGLDMQGHLQKFVSTQKPEETKRGLQQADLVQRKAYFGLTQSLPG